MSKWQSAQATLDAEADKAKAAGTEREAEQDSRRELFQAFSRATVSELQLLHELRIPYRAARKGNDVRLVSWDTTKRAKLLRERMRRLRELVAALRRHQWDHWIDQLKASSAKVVLLAVSDGESDATLRKLLKSSPQLDYDLNDALDETMEFIWPDAGAADRPLSSLRLLIKLRDDETYRQGVLQREVRERLREYEGLAEELRGLLVRHRKLTPGDRLTDFFLESPLVRILYSRAPDDLAKADDALAMSLAEVIDALTFDAEDEEVERMWQIIDEHCGPMGSGDMEFGADGTIRIPEESVRAYGVLLDQINLGPAPGFARKFPISSFDAKIVEGDVPSVCPKADRKLPEEFLPQVLAVFQDHGLVGEGQTIHWVGSQSKIEHVCTCYTSDGKLRADQPKAGKSKERGRRTGLSELQIDAQVLSLLVTFYKYESGTISDERQITGKYVVEKIHIPKERITESFTRLFGRADGRTGFQVHLALLRSGKLGQKLEQILGETPQATGWGHTIDGSTNPDRRSEDDGSD